jgi:non-canonical purine NTP pyrophosphatase (RdgB/HAM1 family)
MSKSIYLITGNKSKLRELQAILPDGISIETVDLDLDEIQSLDLEEIVKDKLKRAYEIIKAPVIVDDVSGGIDELHGLPGPFFKFFYQKLGDTVLLQLAGEPGKKATITCSAGYYDGKRFIVEKGVVHATIVEPRGTNNFGFDAVVQPEGHEKTYAEMTPEEKRRISHRTQAFQALFKALRGAKVID